MVDFRYRIFETRRFLADLEKLDPSVRAPVRKKLENYVYLQLRHEPHVGKNIRKLQNWVPETWRYRIGDWRFFYEIHENDRTLYFTALDHRREAYR